jgi:hypothetical protein
LPAQPQTNSAFPKKEFSMTNNKNLTEKKPGEKAPGKLHYNPVNMSGKTIDLEKTESGSSKVGGSLEERKKEEKTIDN